MKIAKNLALMVLLVLAFTKASYAQDNRPDTVWAVIKSNKDLSKFADLAASAGVDVDLKATGKKITVFAPSNDAVDDIPSDVMKKAKADKNSLRSLILYHTIMGSAVFSDSIRGRSASPSTGNGEMLGFDGRGKELNVGSATITTPDLGAKNGVVHVLNAPLIPLSLDDKAAQKLKDAQEAETKKMNDEMKAREEKMEAERAKTEAAQAKGNAAGSKTMPSTAPVTDKTNETTPSKTPTEAAPSMVPTSPPAPADKQEKAGWKKMLGL